MSNANRIVLWLVGALLVAAAGWYAYWFSNNFEKRFREVRVDISPEARRNPFLAVERFLMQNQQPVSSVRNPDIFSQQPGPNDTIFLGNFSWLFLKRNHDALWEWIEGGGHLIFVAYDRDEEDKPLALLDELGVEVVRLNDEDTDVHCSDSLEPCLDKKDDEPDSFDDYAWEKRVTVSFQGNEPGEFLARFHANRYLVDNNESADVVIGDEWMPNLLQIPLGDGRVTVLSDNELFTNFHIGEKDHAYLLSRLVSNSDKVWIFYGAEVPSLLQTLWQRAPYLIVLAALLLLLAGWRMLQRSGPLLVNHLDARRNLLEHLDASAQYSWRIDRAQQMFNTNRDSVEQAWRRRHPQLNGLEQQARCEWIGEKSGISARAVARTLYEGIESEQDFIRASAVLQRLATLVRPAAHHNE